MSDLRVRDLATEGEVQALRGEVARLQAELVAKNAALLDVAQVAEEAGLVLQGVYRHARRCAFDNSGPDADDDQAGGRGEPTWPSYQLPSPPPTSPYPHPPRDSGRR